MIRSIIPTEVKQLHHSRDDFVNLACMFARTKALLEHKISFSDASHDQNSQQRQVSVPLCSAHRHLLLQKCRNIKENLSDCNNIVEIAVSMCVPTLEQDKND